MNDCDCLDKDSHEWGCEHWQGISGVAFIGEEGKAHLEYLEAMAKWAREWAIPTLYYYNDPTRLKEVYKAIGHKELFKRYHQRAADTTTKLPKEYYSPAENLEFEDE